MRRKLKVTTYLEGRKRGKNEGEREKIHALLTKAME